MTLETVAFRTRARTIDHLGREQIADCPTAISELWKNAYDAYARKVALHIYDGSPAIATIVDDGHGMNREEFIDRWLVVGTESKATGSETPDEDRNGLSFRPKQGQKGIGRLSSAALGPLLLVVSKRRNTPFVAALIDWRLFENPFLYLQDIEIPVVEFEAKEQLQDVLPNLFDRHMGNVWGSGEDAGRDDRISSAWSQFDALETAEKRQSTRKQIEEVAIDTAFEPRHFEQWPVWAGDAETGTILAVSDIQFDLLAQLETRNTAEMDSSVVHAQERLFQTLSNFTDPYLDTDELKTSYGAGGFTCSVTAWEGALQRPIISTAKEFAPLDFEAQEHIVDGTFDAKGVFRGKIKAFGTWLDGEITINPQGVMPTRANTKVGPFHFRIGTFESDASKTTLTEESHRHIKEQAILYGGLLVYRNGLRVMPYGREDNDFFEIEKRRSMHAGREFWSYRRMFGRAALRVEDNPNLRDKAGREGLIDNKSAKVFRDLVINVLKTTARNYFGESSDLRKQTLPSIKEDYAKKKAEEARNQQRNKRRRQFRGNLKRLAPELRAVLDEIEALANSLRTADTQSETEVVHMLEQLGDLKRRSKEFALGDVPRNLSTSLEQDYLTYRQQQRQAAALITDIDKSLVTTLDKIKPRSPRDIAYAELSANASFLQRRLRRWNTDAGKLLASERERLTALYEERSKAYHAVTLPLLDDVEHERLSLSEVLHRLTTEQDKQDYDNAEIFEPYILALESLQESIDLSAVASFSLDEAEELRAELDRIHNLAQLGITVEIIGHEMEGLEHAVAAGLDEFPDEIKASKTYKNVKDSHEALIDRLRFLSPLKLSGNRVKQDLNGKMIDEYLRRFFRDSLEQRGVNLESTEAFLRFSVHELPSRIYPVFINLVNNAAYWVTQTRNNARRVLLDVVDNRVVVADDGPGVDEDDVRRLFTLFFSRKVRGGRGVGLYLCRTNLSGGGHRIEYVVDEEKRLLPGANFAIEFVGASYG